MENLAPDIQTELQRHLSYIHHSAARAAGNYAQQALAAARAKRKYKLLGDIASFNALERHCELDGSVEHSAFQQAINDLICEK